MVVIGNLVTKMTLDTSGLKAGGQDGAREVNRLERSFGSLGSSISGIRTAVTGIFAMDAVRMGLDVARSMRDAFNEVRNEIDETSKAARRLGMTTQDLRELTLVADLAGVEGFQSSIERMTKGIAEAAGGGGRAKAAIADLGLDAGALKQMGSEKALLAIADAMGRIPNEADRVRIAMKIFGNDGIQMLSLMEGGAASLQIQLESAGSLLGKLTDEQAANVERMNDNLTRMEAIWKGLKQRAVAGLATRLEAGGENDWMAQAAGLTAILFLYKQFSDAYKAQEEAARRAVELEAKRLEVMARLEEPARILRQEMERIAKASEKGYDLEKSITGRLDSLSLGDRGAKIQQWKSDSRAAGMDPKEIERRARMMELWGKAIDAIESKQKRWNDAKSMVEDAKSPYEKHLDQIDKLNRYRREGLLTEEQYNKLLEQENKRFKEIQDRGNPLVAKADQIKESIRTPLDDLQKGMAEIDEMISQGLLTDEEAGKAKNKILDDYAGTIGQMATESPQALLRGTAEGYNASIQTPATDTKEYLRKIAEEHLAQLQQQNGHLQKIADKPEPKLATVGR